MAILANVAQLTSVMDYLPNSLKNRIGETKVLQLVTIKLNKQRFCYTVDTFLSAFSFSYFYFRILRSRIILNFE